MGIGRPGGRAGGQGAFGEDSKRVNGEGGDLGMGRARIRPRRVVGDRTAGIVLASHPHAMNAEYEPAGRKTHKPCGRVGAARSSSLADVM